MKKWLLHHLYELKTIQSSPHSIAAGFAIGSLISILPTPGFNFILGFLMILIFPRISKISILAALIFWNPIVSIPIYAGSFALGNILFSSAPVVNYNMVFFNHAVNFTRRYLIGNLIIAVSLMPFCYFIPYYVSKKYQKNQIK